MHIPHVNLALIILSYGSFCNDESDNVNDAKHIDSFIPFSLREYLLGHSHGVRRRQRWGGGGGGGGGGGAVGSGMGRVQLLEGSNTHERGD